MQIVIERFEEDNLQTLGGLSLFDSSEIFICKTIELPWKNNKRDVSRIPANHYPAVIHHSPRFGHCIWIQEVPNRSEILIHPANFVGSSNPKTGKPDLLGCIGVGREFKDMDSDGIMDLYDSANTMKELMSLVSEPLYVNIIDNF